VGNWYEVTNGAATKYYYFGAQRVAMKQGEYNGQVRKATDIVRSQVCPFNFEVVWHPSPRAPA
jgi:hypothetical protein